MRRFKQWCVELLKRIIRSIRQWLNRSRFVLGLTCLVIGVSFTFSFYEGKPYYDQIKTYVEGQREGYAYAQEFLNKADKGVVVKAVAYPANEKSVMEEQDLSDTTSPVSQIADEIWMLESTRGKNNYSKCEAIGKVNGIGYGIWGGNWMCFDSHEEEMETLEKWISEKRDKGMTDKELKCLYSGQNYKICK